MSNVPAALLDLALNTLEDEVPCWRKMPWAPGYVRLMRFPRMDTIGPAEIPAEEDQKITYHDVPTDIADDLILRFAMEKVLESVIGAISVAPAEPAEAE